MCDDEKTVYWVRDRDGDGRWHRATPKGGQPISGCVVCERSCDGETLWVVPEGGTDVRTERYTAHLVAPCAACDVIHLRASRARMVTSIAEAFDVPEHVIDAAGHSTPAGWTWGKIASHGVWHLWAKATDGADTVIMACGRIDSDASVDRDSLARRSDEYREGRANCSTCRALWPWVRTFDDATSDRDHVSYDRLRVGLDQAVRSLGTVVREREALRRERNDAITASLERIKERDNALRAVKLMKGARDRDLASYDRLRRERNEAVVHADAADAEVKWARGCYRSALKRLHVTEAANTSNEAEAARLRRELTEVVKERDDLRNEAMCKAWAGSSISFTATVDDAAFEAVSGFKVVRTHTRYGRITMATGQPLPFTPVCALCPDEGRHLMSRASRSNALYALTLHVVRSHANSVPLSRTSDEGSWHAQCSFEGCETWFTAVDEDTQSLRRRIVSHEIDRHSEES